MKIIVCGSRNWTSFDKIRKVLKKLNKNTIIVEGACRGADYIAGIIAKNLGLNVIEVPAEWEKYGKAAGHIRNKKMLGMGVSKIIAFHEDIAKSKGTLNMVNQAIKAGIPVLQIK